MPLKDERLLTADEICEITGFSCQTLWRHTRSGTFPEPIKFGERIIPWRGSDIEQFLEAKGDVSSIKKGRKPRAN